jgi:multiple sugar transport system ATP-binding protein
MARVQLQHVDKTFPSGIAAVRNLSLDVADGELFVLVGPSGCGKTTTLRLVAGLEQPTRGEILIGERRVNEVPPADRDVAMVFQNAALYPHMNVAENLAFGLKRRRMPAAEIQRRMKEAAEALSIGNLLDRRPAELSGGERGRVAIGRAMVRGPKVFLLDEPLSDLDLPMRSQLRMEIGRLHERLRSTIVHVTHDQAEAMTLGGRIGVMKDGEIQQIDTPANVYRRPASAFVASFIGNPGMNLIPGEVRGGVFQWAQGSQNGHPAGSIHVGLAVKDGNALLGVRPDDLLVAGGTPLVTAAVEQVERTGHETLIHFELGGRRQVARLPGNAGVSQHELVPVGVRPTEDVLHLFDMEGRRIR